MAADAVTWLSGAEDCHRYTYSSSGEYGDTLLAIIPVLSGITGDYSSFAIPAAVAELSPAPSHTTTVELFGWRTQQPVERTAEVVFVELPEIDTAFGQGDDISVIESVKAASELKAPVSGCIVAVNEVLTDEPNIVNDDPMDAGWFCRIKLSDPSEIDALLDEDAYNATLD